MKTIAFFGYLLRHFVSIDDYSSHKEKGGQRVIFSTVATEISQTDKGLLFRTGTNLLYIIVRNWNMPERIGWKKLPGEGNLEV